MLTALPPCVLPMACRHFFANGKTLPVVGTPQGARQAATHTAGMDERNSSWKQTVLAVPLDADERRGCAATYVARGRSRCCPRRLGAPLSRWAGSTLGPRRWRRSGLVACFMDTGSQVLAV
jgi:hypothetical protein